MAKTKAALKVADQQGVKSQSKDAVQHSQTASRAYAFSELLENLSPSRVILLLTLACCLAYANALGGDFVFDDTEQIVENKDIRSWDNLGKAFTTHVWAFREKPEALRIPIPPPYYRPLFTVLFTVEYQLFGLHPQGWHLVNLLLHTLCAIAVYFVIAELARRKFIALLAALFFAVYSIHVESVAWISGVTDPLFSLFFLASLYGYLRHRANRQRRRLLWSLVWFLFAAFSKETALSLVPLIFAFEWIASGKAGNPDSVNKKSVRQPSYAERLRQATLATLPYVAVVIVYLVPRFLVLGGLTWYNPHAYHGPFFHTLLTLPWVVCTYLFHLTFPVNLSIAYFTSFETQPMSVRFLVPLLILFSLAGLIVAYRKRLSRNFWYALGLFVIPMLPVLDLRQLSVEYLIFDRYLYLSVAGWSYFIALAVIKLADYEGRRQSEAPNRFPVFRRLGLASLTALILIVLLTAATVRENQNWASAYALWSNAAHIRPQFWATHYNTGLALLDEARADASNARPKYEKARDAFLKATQVTQAEPSIFNALGQAYDALDETPKAIESFQRAIVIEPETFEAINNLGTIYFKAGDYSTAERYFKSCLALKPQTVAARFNLALGYEKQARSAEVVTQLNEILQYAPDDAEVLYHLGLAYGKLSRKDEAVRTLKQALAISRAKNIKELSDKASESLKSLTAVNSEQ